MARPLRNTLVLLLELETCLPSMSGTKSGACPPPHTQTSCSGWPVGQSARIPGFMSRHTTFRAFQLYQRRSTPLTCSSLTPSRSIHTAGDRGNQAVRAPSPRTQPRLLGPSSLSKGLQPQWPLVCRFGWTSSAGIQAEMEKAAPLQSAYQSAARRCTRCEGFCWRAGGVLSALFGSSTPTWTATATLCSTAPAWFRQGRSGQSSRSGR
mmetsp:Transcript_2151/g.8317  ORF Transcript_2151/g.8317 Transcript_2151/m.8317 type:complete len:208 (-) Transcript_2151:3532-4155(-)